LHGQTTRPGIYRCLTCHKRIAGMLDILFQDLNARRRPAKPLIWLGMGAYKGPRHGLLGWRPGLFKDQRAAQIGDILTVIITIADEATMDNKTSRTRDSAEDPDLTILLGYEATLDRVPPQTNTPTNLANLGRKSSSTGTSSIARKW
jgi:hypothetical protein|tara:strand:+ start:229 stop:669 length:441 start_codon:yes stop_codon:yes gene_type:complete